MEPMQFRRNAWLERLEWSGCKAGESVIVRGRNRAGTWCGVSHAGEQSTSGGSVKPGLLPFPTEERSDEDSMPDPARAMIVELPERLECANDIRKYGTTKRARGVAKGPPSMTSVNQRWRPGQARQGAGERQAFRACGHEYRKWKP